MFLNGLSLKVEHIEILTKIELISVEGATLAKNSRYSLNVIKEYQLLDYW